MQTRSKLAVLAFGTLIALAPATAFAAACPPKDADHGHTPGHGHHKPKDDNKPKDEHGPKDEPKPIPPVEEFPGPVLPPDAPAAPAPTPPADSVEPCPDDDLEPVLDANGQPTKDADGNFICVYDVYEPGPIEPSPVPVTTVAPHKGPQRPQAAPGAPHKARVAPEAVQASTAQELPLTGPSRSSIVLLLGALTALGIGATVLYLTRHRELPTR